MKARTIATQARVQARGRTTRTILALSLAVVLLGATASTGSTSPTPPTPPLTLSGSEGAFATAEKLRFHVTTSNDSTVVVRGDVRKKTKQSTAGELTTFKVKLKHRKRLYGKPRFKAKIKVAATDEFGQTATDVIKYVLRRCPDGGIRYGTPHYCEDEL